MLIYSHTGFAFYSSTSQPSEYRLRGYCKSARCFLLEITKVVVFANRRAVRRGESISEEKKRRIMAMTPFGSRFGSIWDPFFASTAGSLLDPFELMDLLPSHARSFARDAHAVAGTRVDWVENENAHIFRADLPGLRKEDVKVELQDDGVLHISGERSKEEEQKTDTWHRVERSHGRFLRQFKLPNDVKTNEVSAKVENGVLTVTVPKAPKPESKVRSITIA